MRIRVFLAVIASVRKIVYPSSATQLQSPVQTGYKPYLHHTAEWLCPRFHSHTTIRILPHQHTR